MFTVIVVTFSLKIAETMAVYRIRNTATSVCLYMYIYVNVMDDDSHGVGS